VERLGVKVPEGQKEKLEEIADEGGYPNRSELVREMIRDLIKQNQMTEERANKLKEKVRHVKQGEMSVDDLKKHEEFLDELGEA